eukprot:TRINITY_DN2247_c0_g1_i3.p1 TRINITY_DN2247_c0_g1~~TRINITY_DN2247_c0_g1_i3.p1  ORF type:complete len:490 (-),score=103.88 TRINITY_DN2247_c0_g1_i3:23-1492(-)
MAPRDEEVESDNEGVQAHLKDAVDGSLRLKRLLSEDSQTDKTAGKKRKVTHHGVSAEHAAKVQQLMAKWDYSGDLLLKHVLEGLDFQEVEELDSTNYVPDKTQQWIYDTKTGRPRPVSIGDIVNKHAVLSRERKTAGGGALDPLAIFKFKWKLSLTPQMETQLRNLCHKDLKYVNEHYDGEKDLAKLIEEASKAETEWNDPIPNSPGIAGLGRFNRLEIIDSTADAAVFGDANLTFSMNLAKHRNALSHVGRVIATTFENYQTLRERYVEIDETIQTIEGLHGEVFHEVDCTRIAVNPQFEGLEGSLGAVYYNFPHAGSVQGFFDGHPVVNWRHENLLRLFFRALRHFVKPGGLVKVSSSLQAVGVRFSYITGGAQENEFTHVETFPLMQWTLRRYGRAYGDRRDSYRRPDKGQGYNVQGAERDMVYTFKYTPSGKTLPPQPIRMPPTLAVLEATTDGPFDSLAEAAKKELARKLHERFKLECSGIHVG